MPERVLVPVDDSAPARAARDLARRAFGDATLVLLHVINPAEAGYSARAGFPSFSEDWFDQQENRAEALLDDLAGPVPDRPVERVVEVGRPTRTIVEYAEDNDIDHVVIGSHGREGVSRLLLGSVAEAVVRRSPVPVTVTR
jgi:nucleotide-binding universal stress UspA family protein